MQYYLLKNINRKQEKNKKSNKRKHNRFTYILYYYIKNRIYNIRVTANLLHNLKKKFIILMKNIFYYAIINIFIFSNIIKLYNYK